MSQPFTVFIIEDDMHLQKMLIDFFHDKFPDIQIKTFLTGEQALLHLGENTHLVILDYFLNLHDEHALDGLAILARIRELNKSIRVVLFTGQSDPEVAAQAIKMGAYDYVAKNAQSFEKLEAVIAHLKRHFVIETPAFNKKLFTILLIGILLIAASFFLASR